MTTARLVVFIVGVLAATTPVRAQSNAFLYGYEFFVTMDSDSLSNWTAGLRNFTCATVDGASETVDYGPPSASFFATWMPTPIAYGTYGPVYLDGSYLFEPFLYSQIFGNQGGFLGLPAFVWVKFGSNSARLGDWRA